MNNVNGVIVYIGLVVVGSLDWIDPAYKIIFIIIGITGAMISYVKFYHYLKDRKEEKKKKS